MGKEIVRLYLKMKIRFYFVKTTMMAIACLFAMQTVQGQAPHRSGFKGFDIEDDTILKFSTEKMDEDLSQCFCIVNSIVNSDTIEADTVKFDGRILKQITDMIWDIPWRDGKNLLRIVLQDKEGKRYTCDTTIYHKHFGYWIVSIGTGDEQNDTLKELPCSSTDAEKFADVIQQTIGFEPEICISRVGDQATKEGIITAADLIGEDILNKKERKALERMALFVYLGGHGKLDEDKNEFYFQVNDAKGKGVPFSQKAWLSGSEISDFGFLKQLEFVDNADVWFFFDACESSKLRGRLKDVFDSITEPPKNNVTIEKGRNLAINRYTAVVKDGKKYKNKKWKGDYCKYIKGVNSIYDVVYETKGDVGNFENQAIHGLYMNFFEKAIDSLRKNNEPIECDELQSCLKDKYYKKHLVDRDPYGRKDPAASLPVKNKETNNNKETSKSTPSNFIDFSIGWNLSKQWNPQIGFTWKQWSAFVEYSVNCTWTTPIVHTLVSADTQTTQDTLPSKSTHGLGVGFRWYPFNNKTSSWYPFKRIDTGFGLSVQTGSIYGENIISDKEIIKHHQSFTSITPSLSIRFFLSRNTRWMCYINVGYVFYFPHNINMEMKPKPFVTNVGLCVPIINSK